MKAYIYLGFILFQTLEYFIQAKTLNNCFLDKKLTTTIICDDLRANINNILNLNTTYNLSQYDKIMFNPIFKNQILNKTNILQTIEYFNKINVTTIDISYLHLKGMDMNTFHNFNSSNMTVNFLFYDSTIDIYSNGSLQTSCNLSLASTTQAVIGKIIFSIRNSFRRKVCPLIFHNLKASNIFIFFLIDTIYKKNILNFEISNDLKSQIRILGIKNCENIIIDSKLLNKKLLQYTIEVVFGGKLREIRPESFTNLPNLRIIVFDIYFVRNLLHKSLDWVKAINNDLNINVNNRTEVVANIRRAVHINIFHSESPYADIKFTANDILPDEDFCLYTQFPFKQLILLTVSDGIRRNFPYNFTCTFHMIRKMNSLLYNSYNVYFPESFLNTLENISHCNFTKMFSNCKIKTKYESDFDFQNFRETIEILDFIVLVFLNPFCCIIGLFFYLYTSFNFKTKNFQTQQYIFIKAYSVFTSIYLILTLLNLINECPFKNSMFCSSIRTLVPIQYYQSIFIMFIRKIIIFMLNTIIVGYTYTKFKNARDCMISKQSEKINLVKYLTISFLFGLLLNSLNFLFSMVNYVYPMGKYPLILVEDSLSLDLSISMILKCLYALNEFINKFIFLLVILVIDIKLILKLRQIFKIESCLRIRLNKVGIDSNRQSAELHKQNKAMPTTIGIIYPPPEVRTIVDKTATFVARNGPEFEEKIRQNEINNPKFNFLNPNDPYYAYYQHKVKEIAEGRTPLEPPTPQPIAQNATLPATLQKMTISSKTQDTQSKIMEQMIILKDPPPEFEFIVDAPSISALDIDVIKLTAQFVARNGRPFLTSIMNKEQRNPMFDFLKPQHSHFNYFTRLVDQYTKILLPPKDLVDKMTREVENPFGVFKNVAYRVEWERVAQREKAQEDEMAEKERVAYAQIDWHDFVVVETVDYQPNEVGNFPPPTTPADVGARVIVQERIESGQLDPNAVDHNGRLLIDRILEDESRVVQETIPKDKNIDQVEMDEDSGEEEKKELKKSMPIRPDIPLPPNPENVIIRPYDPKAKQVKKPNKSEEYFKSPITGELIPASMMSEHMRISTLDPKWLEQKQRERKEREEQEDPLAGGFSIEANLKRLAEYRSDMFGSGAEETLIGKKKGEEDKKEKDLATWDGHSNSVEMTSKRALSGITVEDQIKAIHQSQGLIGDETSKIGPTIPTPIITSALNTTVIKQAPPQPPTQPIMVSNYKILNVPVQPVVIQTVPVAPPPQPVNTQPVVHMPAELEEPASKRQKTEEHLIPEVDFLAQYQSRGPVKFYVQCPSVPDKPEWNLNGQSLPITMPLTETDQNTLAYYNLYPESVIQLQLKERGGRKK
ncbi:unnamed protein product [Brachionus calyciflorus]|uniref:SURP motif domain-containing protein n=1 Tax=Brachionus calyciflorus TaxID=104777 RepID=A0A814EUB7_9BILA|nr:unnamed protein product [Brachionus calyciflorus]